MKITYTTQFRKDYKLAVKQGKDFSSFKSVVDALTAGRPMDKRFRDHRLSGVMIDCRELHIKPDWLLIYKLDLPADELILIRMGSHSQLFK